MKAAWLLTAVFLAAPALATDCPTPKPLTCEQLRARIKSRHCSLDALCPNAGAVAPSAPAEAKAPPCTPTVETKYVTVETAAAAVPRGNWLAGGGALYQTGWGLQGFAGYQWANGVQFLIGPNYVPHSDHTGVTGCPTDGIVDHDTHCVTYNSPGASSWGGAAVVIFKLGNK